MGAYSSQFQTDEHDAVLKSSHPSQANWITSHAIATELSIAEVERLWVRFQQLGCDGDGVLTPPILQSQKLSEDGFVKNILRNVRSESGSVTFQNYLNMMKWAELATIDQKLRAVFALLNSGNVVNKEMLLRIMRRVYPDENDDALRRAVEKFFTILDPRKQGTIDEDQFVSGMQKLPMYTLNSVLAFSILPVNMKERLHNNVPEFGHGEVSPRTPYGRSQYPGQNIPSDETLREIAEKIGRRDWPRVANKLDFLSDDIESFRSAYPSDTSRQAYNMLKTWKERERNQAYTHILEKALKGAGMSDAAFIVSP